MYNKYCFPWSGAERMGDDTKADAAASHELVANTNAIFI